MKIHFESSLQYQTSAVESVCDLFQGQEVSRSVFTVPKERSFGVGQSDTKQLSLPGIEATGFGNRLQLLDDEILKNLQQIQLRNGLKQSPRLESGDFTVEMETGTGKTYVYLKTIFELHKRYGFTKFIIVVPSVAIKEGVYKTLEMTEQHFKSLYDHTPFEYFLYDSNKLGQVRNFATSSDIQIMVITVGSINKKDVNKLYDDSEKTGGEIPINLIKATRPILIVDEPQSVDGGLKGQGKAALEKMSPLCTLRYSATHALKHHMVYKLDAVDAYEQELVKQIEVAALETEGAHNKPYVKFLSAENRGGQISAKVELDFLVGTKIKRSTATIRAGDNLGQTTSRSEYANFDVENIGWKPKEEFLELSNLENPMRLGQWLGDVEDDTIKRVMIRRTIEEHFEKELRLRPRGIKVLSLFFIDRVEFYRSYDEAGAAERGKYALMFEEEFIKLAAVPKFKSLFTSKNLEFESRDAHDGYFSVDKKKRWTDTEESSKEAEQAFNLIMKEKEKLLSFDTKLRFIFSHSALKEGWDNPNVFQICTLRDMSTERSRRQTIGRGLRLCVNQNGDRVRGFNANTLTVIATEKYEDFAKNLQKEIYDDTGIEFGLVEDHQFANIPVEDENGQLLPLGVEKSTQIVKALKEEGFLDRRGQVQNSLRQSLKDDTLQLPPEFQKHVVQVTQILRKLAGKLEIKNADERRTVKTRQAILHSEEFQSLWNRICKKTTYRVDFDDQKLIDECAKSLKQAQAIARAKIRIRKAEVEIGRGGVSSIETSVSDPMFVDDSADLPDLLTELQDRTSLTRRSILQILVQSERLEDFKRNPQQFIELAAESIMRTKRLLLVDGIKYQKLGDSHYWAQELFENEELTGYVKNMLETSKSVHEYVVYDSAGIEQSFAEQLELNNSVRVYAKLPKWFKIPTPLGSYNPDWAVLIEVDRVERLYFVVETKGSLYSEDLRGTESGKIKCGAAHFAALAVDSTNPARFIKATSVEDVIAHI